MMEKGAILCRAVRKELFEEVALNPRPDGQGELAMQTSGGKTFPARGESEAKFLREDWAEVLGGLENQR